MHFFQYHVTHDASVYAIRRRNGEYTLTVLLLKGENQSVLIHGRGCIHVTHFNTTFC